jgi:hypothetical protein
MHQKYYQKYYLWQEEEDGLCHPVLDSLDNYKMLSERMNVLTIYLPFRKLPVASNLRIVKTAVLNPHTLFYLIPILDNTVVNIYMHPLLAM